MFVQTRRSKAAEVADNWERSYKGDRDGKNRITTLIQHGFAVTALNWQQRLLMDNDSNHRAAASGPNYSNARSRRLRVHCIVIGRIMVEWKDASSWSKRDSKEVRATPKTWTATIGKFRVSVSRHIYHDPDVWVLSCRPDLFSGVEAESKNIEEAKCQAVAMLQAACEDTVAEIVAA